MDLTERRPGTVRRHPWELARARFFRRLAAVHADLAAVHRVLDIGAGDGWFASEVAHDLPAQAEVVCWDINYRSEDLSAPVEPGVRRTATGPAGAFDVVFALDVLEHVVDDESFVADSVVPALAPTGLAVLSVPAHPRLYSEHDRMLEHVHRYRPAEFRALVRRHLEVVATGSLFATLLAPRAVEVVRHRLGRATEPSGVGAWSGGPVLTRFLTAVLDADAAANAGLARFGLGLPGLSTWAVARPRAS